MKTSKDIPSKTESWGWYPLHFMLKSRIMRGNPGNVNIIPLSSCLFILIVSLTFHPKSRYLKNQKCGWSVDAARWWMRVRFHVFSGSTREKSKVEASENRPWRLGPLAARWWFHPWRPGDGWEWGPELGKIKSGGHLSAQGGCAPLPENEQIYMKPIECFALSFAGTIECFAVPWTTGCAPLPENEQIYMKPIECFAVPWTTG